MWDNLWTFKTKHFAVTLDWQPEDSPDLSWDDTGEAREKIESGEWTNATFRVRVTYDGRELATDYLGNSIYARLDAFRLEHLGLAAKRRADGINYGCYFPDMVRTAVTEAREELRRLQSVRVREHA